MTLRRYPERRTYAALVASVLGLAGCTVGPDFATPTTPLAESSDYLDTGLPVRRAGRLLSRTTEAEPDVAWWQAFRDPVLSQLEDRVAAQNLDVQTATARLFESRAQLGSAAAAGLPTINGQGSAYRQQFSKNGTIGLLSNSLGSLGGGTGGSNPTAPLTNGFESYTLGFDASWELDLWGKVRRSVESAQAQADASAEQRRDALVSSQAELARDYVQLRGTQELIRIDLANIRVNEQILDVVRVRQQKGLVTGLDTSNAAQQVEAIKAQLPQLQQQEIQQINAISLLLGEPPLALSQELVAGRAIPPVPPRVPVGVPSSLVLRRPDIRRAEANLHSAVAEIGVAEAQFFPSVTLTGSPTVNSVDPGKLFRGSSLQYMNIGPSISIPLFEGGRLKSNLVLQRARQQEAAIAYQKAVLQGWHDVVNALASLRGDEARRGRLARQVADARQALSLSRARYTQGVEIFTTVLQASQTVLQAETNLSQATAAISTDFVALSKALGGGWETTFPSGRTPPLSLAKVGIPVSDVVHGTPFDQ
ncbi:putative efflux pump outer membrane protein TtgC [Methylobacterium cerastii]|uniref:Efflux pump outer membrane protein TtgC n=1 Tax=Methylobacterium cerastii TaxID=932741 RepID=A0ABQ4QPE1_9HYPH|nr:MULTISPECIES: efflux transporter outer membrane subunit [Methylobacterium]TXM73789.1 efflux transporter outer membrane subunit [Methylobacterium sp. WL12]GJD47099.1 putative efflux pump outer membrane protein TtgC [Methylobacterium cerastii]